MDNKEKDYLLVTYTNGTTEHTIWYHRREWEKINDWDKWGRYDKDKFWEKYPENKPATEPTRVILDEVDKIAFASEEHKQAYINSFNNK